MSHHHNLLINLFPAIGVILSAWMGWFPAAITIIMTGLAAFWYGIQIWETRTVVRWRRRMGWRVPEDLNDYGGL